LFGRWARLSRPSMIARFFGEMLATSELGRMCGKRRIVGVEN
jgi:hypothetical protein